MTIPSTEQMIEIKKHAVTCKLAADLSGKTDQQIAQDLFLALPSKHFLLHDPWARYEFNSLLRKQRGKK